MKTEKLLLLAAVGVGGFLLYKKFATPPATLSGSGYDQGGVGSGGTDKPSTYDKIQGGIDTAQGVWAGAKKLWDDIF